MRKSEEIRETASLVIVAAGVIYLFAAVMAAKGSGRYPLGRNYKPN